VSASPPPAPPAEPDTADSTPKPDDTGRTHGSKVFRYLINTGLSFAVNLGLTALLHEAMGVREELAYAVALAVVFVMNFLMFRFYVFDGRSDQPGKQVGLFLGTSIVFRLVEYLGFLLVHSVLGVYYLLAIVLVQGSTFVIKYFVYGGWIFKRTPSKPAAETPHG
jgi:putative flippase GtrA